MAVTVVIRGENQASGAINDVKGEIKGLESTAKESGGGLSGFFGGAVKGGMVVAGGAALGLGAALVGGVKSGLDFNNSMEQVTAKLNAFTKDGGKSAQILEDIKKEASTTPFAFNEMAQATAALLPTAKASGKELMSLVKTAEILAASNPAEGLEGAAFALKEAASGDLTSVIERFNLPRARLNELKEQGVPAIEAVGIAMKELGLDADLVGNMANTMEGRWSTFTDTLTNLAATATKPIFDAMSGGLAKLQGVLDANQPAIQGVADAIATGLGNAINWAVNTGIPMLIAGWDTIQPALAVLQATFQAVFGAIQAIVQAVLPIIAGFIQEHGAEITAFFQTTWTQISTIIRTAIQLYNAIVPPILTAIAGFIQAHGTEIQAIISAVWTGISAFISGTLALIQGIIQAALLLIQGDFSGAWEAISTACAAFMTGLFTLIQSELTIISTIWLALWSDMKAKFEEILDSLVGWVAQTFEGIKNKITSLADGIGSAAASVGSAIVSGITGAIRSGVDAIASAARSAAMSALSAAKAALGIGSPSKVFAEQVGGGIVDGMTQGITRGMAQVQAAGAALAGAAVPSGQAVATAAQGRASTTASQPANGSIRLSVDDRGMSWLKQIIRVEVDGVLNQQSGSADIRMRTQTQGAR